MKGRMASASKGWHSPLHSLHYHLSSHPPSLPPSLSPSLPPSVPTWYVHLVALELAGVEMPLVRQPAQGG